MRIMIIDVGSNTVKYDVFETRGWGFTKLGRDSRIVGFIGYIDKDGDPTLEGVYKLAEVLNEYKKTAKEMNCHEVAVFATASFRRCKFPEAVAKSVYTLTRLNIHLVSGREEAELSLLGVLTCHPKTQSGIVSDMGGGSTELNVYDGRKGKYCTSLPFGALSLKNKFVELKPGPVGEYASPEELDRIYEYVTDTVRSAKLPANSGDFMFIVGGSARAIGYLMGHHIGNKWEFPTSELDRLISEYREMTPEKAELLKKLAPERERLIIPAVVAFRAISDIWGIKSLEVARGGIREGYLKKYFMDK